MARRATIRLALLGIVALAWLGPAVDRAVAAPTIIYDCSPAPFDCNGWFRSNVSLAWTVLPSTAVKTGCGDIMLTADSKAAYQYCTARATDGSRSTIELWLKIDKTPPTVIAPAFARPADGNGWFRAPVAIAYRGTDPTSGIRSCTSTSYAGPNNRAAHVTGTCTDVAGNTSAAKKFTVKYDATPPKVRRGRPKRKPDHGRWYNHPVAWHFRGRDRLSGLAACPTVVYRGPAGRRAHVIGACRDKAGNVGTRAFRLHYDATAPAAPRVRTIAHDRSVRLSIRAGHDVRRMSIVRAPGVGGARDSTVYRGRAKSFTDRRVNNGRRYAYTITVRDRAANRTSMVVHARPDVGLLSPPNGAQLAAPPLLRWTTIRGADYYNVQLLRDGRKVLSTWPGRPRLQLKARWRFEGHVRRLVPGHYRWDVWPGFGSRSAAHYGRRVGGRSFVIPAAPPAQ
jgi:hypothetical protein